MMFLENWLVYPAPPRDWGNWKPTGYRYEDVHFTSSDGTALHGWFFAQPSTSRAILYCHGNGEDVAAVGEFAAQLSSVIHANVFAFDYRGYGQSSGRPTEAGCIADGSAAQRWLAERLGMEQRDVILMGRSLGSAVAVALAAANGARALVLENAFTTMPDVASLHYPWLPVYWFMKNRYDNMARIRRYTGPLLQTHGTADVLIPIELARSLFDAAPSKHKKWVEFPGVGHNDPEPAGFFAELATFVDDAGASPIGRGTSSNP